MHPRVPIAAACALTVSLTLVPAARAQTRPGDAECQAMRERLAGHAALSEGVRRSLLPRGVAAVAPAPAPAAQPASRADTIRARLAAIPAERQALEEQRLGALMRFDLTRVNELQAKMNALDAERASLEAEQRGQPPASPAPATPPPATPPPATVGDASRVPCRDVAAALDRAVNIRQRELGAKEGQAGVVPLVAVKGPSSDQMARELADQMAPTPAAPAPVGLLDADGSGQVDAVVDVPAPGVYRLVRKRADGALGVETFTEATGAPAYGDLTRRVDEAVVRQTAQTLEGWLATRPAGVVRTVTETGEFGRAQARWLAGDLDATAKIDGPAARATEFQNLRGETVRVMELIAPVSSGLSVRRLVILARPDGEAWEGTTTIVRPVSYWRTDLEVTRSQESRSVTGAPTAARAVSGPFRLSLER